MGSAPTLSGALLTENSFGVQSKELLLPSKGKPTATPHSSQYRNHQFHLFPLLPQELRVQIWKRALVPFEKPQILEVKYDDDVTNYWCVNRVELVMENPHFVALAVKGACQESERVVNSNIPEDAKDRPMASYSFLTNMINPSNDILFFKTLDPSEFSSVISHLTPMSSGDDHAQLTGKLDPADEDDLPNALLTMSTFTNAVKDPASTAIDTNILVRTFLSMARKSVTILLDEPDDSHIVYQDLMITEIRRDTLIEDSIPHYGFLKAIQDWQKLHWENGDDWSLQTNYARLKHLVR